MGTKRLSGIGDVRNILVAVVGVILWWRIGKIEDKRTGGDGFGGIPNEELRVLSCEFYVSDLEITIVSEDFVGVCYRVAGFEIGDSPPHAVVRHGDKGLGVCVGGNTLPEDWAVFTVVGDGPDAGCGLDESLVAIVVELGDEFLAQRR